MNQSLGSKKMASAGAHVWIHSLSLTSEHKAVFPQGQKFNIDSPKPTPSLKLPLETPSVPCAIILFPATFVIRSLVEYLNSALRSLIINSNSFSLVEFPLYNAAFTVELSVTSNAVFPVKMPCYLFILPELTSF